MNASFIVFELSVACIVRPAPAEKPIMPMRAVSTSHSLARLTMSAYAASASCSWFDKSHRGCAGRGALSPAPDDPAAAKVRSIDCLSPSSDSGVGWSRYLSTNAAIPFAFSASATSQPSLPIDSHRKPPPGATITAAPVALPGAGRNGVSVAVDTLRAIGLPH